MRYPESHEKKVRASIVKNAARALRREGLAGVSIRALLKKAGLTHSGFALAARGFIRLVEQELHQDFSAVPRSAARPPAARARTAASRH